MLRPFVVAVAVFSLAACDKKPEPEDAAPPITQGYVGSQMCGLCHGEYLTPNLHPTYFDDWLNSVHGQTADNLPSDTTIVADSDGNGRNDFEDGMDLAGFTAWFPFTFDGGAPAELAPVLGFDPGLGVFSITLGTRAFALEKVIGIGRHQQLYLTRIENSLYTLPARYDVDGGTWTVYRPENWYTWVDVDGNGILDGGEPVTGLLYPGLSDTPVGLGRTLDAWEADCVGCHATGITSLTTNAEGEVIAEFAEEGVSCEACHGPGRLHAYTLGGRDFPDRAIVNPGKITADRHDQLCRSCHSRGTSVGMLAGAPLAYPWRADDSPYVPGEDLTEAFTVGGPPDEPLHALQGEHPHRDEVGLWTSTCQDCHVAHDTSNLSLVRLRIETPLSGPRDVVFTSRNEMGDATNGVFTEICEVCHTQTEYFRNDSSTPDTGHNNGAVCTDCHEHARGFRRSESAGGESCDGCHSLLTDRMTATAPTSYHHVMDDVSAVYPLDTSTLRCLSCHVDHDLFRPDLNPSGGRGRNLRTDIALAPTTDTELANADFVPAGNGGICLSCHKDALAKSYTPPDGTTFTPAIPFAGSTAQQVAAYQASPHGAYTVGSAFSGEGINTFAANCSKCHNDTMSPKSSVGAQSGEPAFGMHDSSLGRMLGPLGAPQADPLEEEQCFRCHARVGDPLAGATKPAAGRDWYDVEDMAAGAERLFDVITNKPFGHDVAAVTGAHRPGEGTAWGWNPSGARHVECSDCHNPHAAGPARAFDTSGTFAQPVAPTNLVAGGPLAGTWGVDVPAWPPAWTVPSPASDYARVESSTYEWQVCLKCHSGYAYDGSPPSGQTDQALEFNPQNPSYHAVIGPSVTTFPPDSSFVGPWTTSSSMACGDCHTSDDKTDPQGPHGSAHGGILAGAFDDTTGTSASTDHLCFKCHLFDVYGRGGAAGAASTGFSDAASGGNENLHTKHAKKDNPAAGRKITCTDCHAAVPHGWQRRALLVLTSDPAPYNNGNAALDPADVSGWPASGKWKESSCDSVFCH